jgi:hypothetical protein
MCGSNNSASNAEQQVQQQQTAETAGNVQAINNAFANRNSQYTSYGNALNQQYQTELARQNTIANRNLKFAMAGAGLSGGSNAADQGQLLGQDEARGTLAAQQQVQGAVSSLEAKDQATKQQMISLAQSGGNIGNAGQETAAALSANYGAAQNQNAAQGLGDVFGDINTMYTNEQTAKNLRSGLQYGLYATPMGRTPTSASPYGS